MKNESITAKTGRRHASPKKIAQYGWEEYAGRYVITDYEYVTNRYGDKTRIARYSLNEVGVKKEA